MAGYAGKVRISGVDYPIATTLIGTCSTAGSTAAKIVTCADFTTLLTGVAIVVKFTYSNTAASPTINVNGTGAYPIYVSGTSSPGITPETSWPANSVVLFVYDGTAWMMLGATMMASIVNEMASQQGQIDTITGTTIPGINSDVSDRELKMLRFTNKSATFSSGNGITNFGYRAAVACDGVTSSMVAYVSFGGNDSGSGDYAPYCQTYDGGVYLYAAKSGTITVPSIICWRA